MIQIGFILAISQYTNYMELFKISGLLALSFLLKSKDIGKANFVVWDEAHFGKFARKYINNEFYFDVHPPLGKLLTALSGYLANQDKDFIFESGTEYPSSVNYAYMRIFHAFVSSFTPIFMYKTMLYVNFEKGAAFFCSLLYIFENGLTILSKFILLDPHLVFFTGLSIMLITKHAMANNDNILTLLMLGISIGCMLSVKWIGCLTTLLIGIFIAYELLTILLSDRSYICFLKSLLTRVVSLIIVPVAIYMFWFYVHFSICHKSTADDGHMSSLFQSRLTNSSIGKVRKYVKYGSLVSIKSSETNGGNLHSHNSKYPNTDDFQITTYYHKDENNMFAFQKIVEGVAEAGYISGNDNVAVYHSSTQSYLTVGNSKGYVTSGDFAVIGTNRGVFSSSLWVVEIVKDQLKASERIKSVTTTFRLYNKEFKCYLRSTSRNYPAWGFTQGEVTCSGSSYTSWNVEKNDLIENDIEEGYLELGDLKKTFIANVIELNVAMYNTNRSLVQDEHEQPPLIVSKPYEWFILLRGLRMNSWDDDKPKFYMFGNPLVWYASSISILISFVYIPLFIIYKRRRLEAIEKGHIFSLYLSVVGWAIHYLPFFIIKRVLYFHHYFPAFIFAVFNAAIHLRNFHRSALIFYILTVAIAFLYFKDFTYGIDGAASKLANRGWVRTWNYTT